MQKNLRTTYARGVVRRLPYCTSNQGKDMAHTEAHSEEHVHGVNSKSR